MKVTPELVSSLTTFGITGPARFGDAWVASTVLPPGAAGSLPVHPLPLYFAAAGLGMTALLLWVRGRKRYDGELGLLLLVLYSATSAILEPLRFEDQTRVYWGPLPQLLWVTGVMTVLSLLLLVVAERRHRSAAREIRPKGQSSDY